MPENGVIHFTAGKDGYFRKSVALASANITLREDKKASGAVERLSATILKAVQDQLFSITRQKEIEAKSKALASKFENDYKESYIANYVTRLSKQRGKTDMNAAKEEALLSYTRIRKRLTSLANKEAWRKTIQDVIQDSEVRFVFDAKSITEYAKVNSGKKSRLYSDIKKMQNRNNEWTEKRFDMESGLIVDKDVNGVLFPYSEYNHGPNATIELKLEKELLHCVLFLSQSFLKFHLDSYLKLETPNATRLYELLINYIENPLVVGHSIPIDELQSKFGTKYESVPKFIVNVISPSVKKINDELGTNIEIIQKKEWKKIVALDFSISETDKKSLLGNREDDISDSLTLTFEYYLMLIEIGGIKIRGGMSDLYDDVKMRLLEGKFDFLEQKKEDVYQDYKKNLEDLAELETLIDRNPDLSSLFVVDKKYLTLAYLSSGDLVEVTASDSLEWLNVNYLVPMGILRGDEAPEVGYYYSKISSMFPFIFAFSPKKVVSVDSSTFNLYEASIVAAIENKDLGSFIFDSDEKRILFCEAFEFDCGDKRAKTINAEIVSSVDDKDDTPLNDTEEIDYLSEMLFDIIRRINPRLLVDSESEWIKAIEKLRLEYDLEDMNANFAFISTQSKDAKFFLSNIVTPMKLLEFFPRLDHARRVENL